jgi:hypothetical protein
MEFDIDLSAVLEVSVLAIEEKGLDQAFKEALNNLKFVLNGYAYIPESMDNLERFEQLGKDLYTDGYYFDANGILVLREGAPNKQNKGVLENL